jgi:hypothetical protein
VRAQTATGVEEYFRVRDVKIDLPDERVLVTFHPRKTHSPDLHDAILKSGYKPGPIAEK